VAPPTTSFVTDRLDRRQLGPAHIVFFAVAAAAPLTVIAGAAVTTVAVTGVTAIPAGYLAVAVALAVFAAGYVAMSRHIVNAGGFYSYITHGLGPAAGISAAGVALTAYAAMQVGLFGAFGYLGSRILNAFDIDTPWWICGLASWAIIGVLGLLDLTLNARVLAVMLCAEVAIVVFYDIIMISHPAGGVVRWDTLQPTQLLDPTTAGVMVVCVAGFVGFEATVVFAEKARNPKHTIAIATYLALGIIGLLYGLSAWAISVATGPAAFVARAQADGAELMFNLVLPHVGQTLVQVGQLFFLTSLFASLLVFHHTVSRYIYALGRAQILPAVCGRKVRQTGAPKVGSLTQTVLALVVITAFAILGWDPMDHLFALVTTAGGLGVLLLMAATCAAVIRFFHRNPRGEPIWRRTIAPVLAGLFLTALAISTIINYGPLLQVASSSPLAWGFPAGYAVVAAAGLIWALWLRWRRPETYRRIGGLDHQPRQPRRPQAASA